MRQAICTVAIALLWTASLAAQRRSADALGGHDVSVALFSTHTVRAVTIAPAGTGAWVARCAVCEHKPLIAGMRFAGRGELFAGGALKVVDDASGEQRNAVGLWHVKSAADGVDVVLTLPSERYVAAVLSAEADTNEPPESLRAMAIAARTYALNGPHYTAATGHLEANFCDSTQCQAMRLGSTSAAVEGAVWETTGETLWFGVRQAEVYFSESCGGMTEDARTVWPAVHAAYLSSHADPYCVRRGTSAWHAEVKLGELAAIAATQHWRLPTEIVSVRVTKRSAAHRALLLGFAGRNGETAAVSAGALRLAIGRSLGWNKVRSDWYDIGARNGALIFDGRGFGHGVGLCQVGAAEMATENKSAGEILAFYFPETHIGIGPEDGGWVADRVADVEVRSRGVLTLDRRRTIGATWTQAERLFMPKSPITPELFFSPSTELFRQMASQPGWMLASTSGTRMVLQPASILGAREQSTLLHEMLHVLVETEASPKASLWLREGLVETLAGETGEVAMDDVAMEAALRHPSTREGSEQAHRAAAAKVRGMISRYGIARVRSWLGSGVPAGVN